MDISKQMRDHDVMKFLAVLPVLKLLCAIKVVSLKKGF